MKKDCVAIISPEFPPYTNWGGVATFNEELSRLLSSLGYEVHVISYSPSWQFSTKEISKNVYHHLIGFRANNKLLNNLYSRFFRPLLKIIFSYLPDFLYFLEWNFFCYHYFKKLEKQKHFITIHVVSYHTPALLIKLFYRSIPMFVHIQGPQEDLNPYQQQGSDSSLKAKLESWFSLYFGDVLISCNAGLAEKLRKLLKRPSQQSLYIPNFITVDKKMPPYLKKINKENIIFWGRLEHRKGVEELLKAFKVFAKVHKDATLWLIGRDESTLKLNQEFVSLKDYLYTQGFSDSVLKRIHHIPRIDSKESLYTFVQLLNGITIFPSLYEPFGFVYIESMMLGLPTIGSTQAESIHLIKEGETGFLCEPTQAEILKKLKYVYSLSPSKLTAITRNAQKQVRAKCTADVIKPVYKALYKQV